MALCNVRILIRQLGWHNRILTRPRFGLSGVQFTAVTSEFPLLPNACGAHPVPYFMGTGVFSSGIKRLEREVDHQPPANAETTYECSYNFTLSTRDIYLSFFKYDNKVVLD